MNVENVSIIDKALTPQNLSNQIYLLILSLPFIWYNISSWHDIPT